MLDMQETPADRFQNLCAVAWDRHGFDRHEFANFVTKQIVTGGDLDLLRHAVFKAAVAEHKQVAHIENEKLLHQRAARDATSEDPPAVVDLAKLANMRAQAAYERKNAARESIFEWRWGVGMKRFGDMTRDELLKIADVEESKARNTLTKCSFIRRVAERLPDGVTVREGLSLETVETIKIQVFGESAA